MPSPSTNPRTARQGDDASRPVRVQCGREVHSTWPALASDLEHVRASGYEAAELAVDNLHCLLNGRLVEHLVERVAAACDDYRPSLAFSVHAPAALDLRDQQDPDLHREILFSSVSFAAAIQASVLVVHYESHSDDPAIETQYRRAIEQAAELAGQSRLILGIENIEVERTERVLEFLEAVRHPWVRMTYDFAHDYLASDLFGYDHLASARACAPYVAHLHITDNFGRFNQARLGNFDLYRALSRTNLLVTGLGDLHLPLGLGTLPARAVFDAVTAEGYTGLLIGEHSREYDDADPQLNARLRALAAGG